MTDTKESALEASLAEFSALRDEILQRLSNQWTIYALQLTASGVVFSFSLSNRSRTGFLLIIPVMAYALLGQFVANHYLIESIGFYIRWDLSPRVQKLSPRADSGFQWEEWWKKRPPTSSAFPWIFTSPVVFPGISLIALGWVVPYILFTNNISTFDRCMLWAVWGVGLVVTTMSSLTIKRLWALKVFNPPDIPPTDTEQAEIARKST